MKNILFSLSLICLFVMGSCKSDSNLKTNKTTAEKVANPNIQTVGLQNYTVDIPIGWTTKEKESNNIKMLVMLSDTLFTDSSTYMNILTERMPKNNIEDYRTGTIKSILDGMPGSTIMEKGDIAAGDLKGNWFTYKTQDSDEKIEGINYSFPKDGVAYIITGGIGIGQLNKHRVTLDSIAKSFRIKE